MRKYIIPQTEIIILNLAQGIMEEGFNTGDAKSVRGGDIQTNLNNTFDDEEEDEYSHTSNLWDEF